MWPLKRKKSQKPRLSSLSCSYCHGNHTVALTPYEGIPANNIKIWRGQRYWICRCLSCGQDFYAEEPPEGLASTVTRDDTLIEDEAELRAAEEEVKRQAEDDGDRRCR